MTKLRWLFPVLALPFAVPALAGDGPVPAPSANAPVAAGAVIGPALNVGDIARSRHFYVDGLGMKVNMTMGAPTRQETMLGFDADPRRPGIILLADTTAKSPRTIAQSNGFDRLVMRMADLDATATRLRAAGFTPSPIRDVAMGYRMMIVTDPDGYRLELVESRTRR
ncbi:MAG: VOC family protein [Sphingomonadales bacterium]|nr:VOC family protein [Sphingomonadales bacterium]